MGFFISMYNREVIKKQCIEAIENEKLVFFTDLIEFIEPSLQTLYDWEFDKLEELKNALSRNKIATKRKMRKNWVQSENATLQLAAYKLMAEQDELAALTMNKVEASGSLNIQWHEEKTYNTK